MAASARRLGWPAAALLTLLVTSDAALAQTAAQLCAIARRQANTAFLQQHCPQQPPRSTAGASGSASAADALRKGDAAQQAGDALATAHNDDAAGVKWDEALRWYRMAAAQGNAEAEYHIGAAYSRGLAGDPDEAAAIKWYKTAAEKGNFDALNTLGDIYLTGEDYSDIMTQVDVPQNYPEAMRWYRLAAAKGDSYGMKSLGDMYRDAEGVAKDDAEAMRWYRLAADKGDTDGMIGVGSLYANGEGVPQDYVQAEQWYRRAADQGDSSAQDDLAELYIKGNVSDNPDATTRKWIAALYGGKEWLAKHPE